MFYKFGSCFVDISFFGLRRPAANRAFLFFALLTLLGATALLGQEFRSTLSGEITDPSGAAVPKAKIVAVKTQSDQTYHAVATRRGAYYVPYMLPGEYTVTITAQGFATQRQEHVVLRGSQTVGLNFKLSVGATSQTVTVTTAPPLLETETGSGGTVLNEREIETLPLNGRQIYSLLGTTPGSQFTQTQFGAGGYSGTRGWDTSNAYTLGGGVQGFQQFYLNGTNITVQNNGAQGTWTIAPNVDSLQEVNLMTTTYDARFGRSGGGSVNMVLKEGSNAFHGEAYEYLENGLMNANTYENNLNGQPRQDLHQNQFGGTVGGPVIKNKVFFFASYEGYREVIPFTTLTSVPPAYLRPQPGQGVNFTQSGYRVFDPATTACTAPGGTLLNCPGSSFSRQMFPNDTIPANRINPIGAAVLNLYPLPNTAGNGLQNNYIVNTPDRYSYDQPIVRVDYNTGTNMRWYSMFAYQHGTEFRNSSGFAPPAENGNINQLRQALVASQDMTYTFSPTLVADFKGSFVRYIQEAPNGDLTTNVNPQTTLGLNMPLVPTEIRPLLPQFTTSDGFYPQVVGNNLGTQYYNATSFDTDFTKTIGNHTIHWGGEIQELQYGNPRSVGSPNGDFAFGTQNTQYNPLLRNQLPGVNDGFDVGDLLLGDPSSGGVDYNHTLFEGFPTWALYAQDDWHVTHHLTINVGLRYDVQVGLRERYNGVNRGLCLSCVNPITNNTVYQANLAADGGALSAAGINPTSLSTVLGGIEFPGVNGQSRDAYNTDYSNIQPRFGFAYQLNSKTVIRGGWGLMYAVGLEAGTTAGFTQTTSYVNTLTNGATPTNYFPSGNPFPNGVEAPPGNSLGLLTNVGNGNSIDFPQRRIPRSQIVSLGFQRELPDQIVLDARFAGNFTNRLRANTSINSTLTLPELEAGIANPNLFNQLVPNPYYNVVPATSTLGSSPTVKALQLMLPLSQYNGQILDYTNPLGTNDYMGLEVKAEKRFSHGLYFRAAYTYSKTMQDTSFLNTYPYQNQNLYRQIGPTDRTHVFSITANYDLPVGKGRAFLSNPNKVVSAFVSGWSVSPVFSFETGFPVTINNSYYYDCHHSYTPDGGPTMRNYLYNDYSSGSKLGCWSTIPQYGLIDLPNRIATLRQPSIPNLDVSVEKDFSIIENIQAKLRLDAFNITNSVLFGGPDTNPNDGPPVQQANGSYTGYGTVGPTQQNFPRILQVSLKVSF